MTWMGKTMHTGKVLVTGGCGFIGLNLVRELRRRGASVKVLDNFSSGRSGAIDGADVAVLEGDVRDPEMLRVAMTGVDAVVHLAALGSVAASMADPKANFENNVVGTFEALGAARAAGVSKFVFASTGGALIGNATVPVDEASLPKPIAPYGASKLCGEAYCQAFGRAYGMETVALRFANVYGPHCAHKSGAVTKFIQAVLNGTPITIYGDGSATRDFLYVDDLCDGIARVLETELEPGTVMHLAAGREVRIDELAALVAEAAGRPQHPIMFAAARDGEVYRNFATYDLANALLGFRPKWTLESGLDRTWQWFLEGWESDRVGLVAQSS